MAYWLFKSEPNTWSWENQTGVETEQWDGVRNYQARNNMRAMAVGDLGFFYHSVNEKRIVGIVRVAAPCHPDTTDDTGTWECVDIAAIRPFETPVTLAEIKGNPKLEGMPLVGNSRLSVQPVSEEHWAEVCRMGGTDPGP